MTNHFNYVDESNYQFIFQTWLANTNYSAFLCTYYVHIYLVIKISFQWRSQLLSGISRYIIRPPSPPTVTTACPFASSLMFNPPGASELSSCIQWASLRLNSSAEHLSMICILQLSSPQVSPKCLPSGELRLSISRLCP